jgi:uncharacterized protein YjbJ (UPF0337 family)
MNMNKQQILGGKWDEVKGKLKQHWAKLTDDDLKAIEGNNLEIYGKLKQHYGYTKEEIERQLERFRKH